MGQPKKNRLSVKFSSYATFRGRPPPFPKRITLLFSVTKILTAVFLIWGNPEKTAFPSSFSLMLLSGATPELPKADYFPCSPRSFWRNKFLRQVAHTLPEANYPLVFRPQNSYRRFFDLWQPRKKPPFRQVFLLCYFRGATSPFKARSPPELPEADYFPCSPRSFWRNKFSRQVAPTLPEADYPLVFRSQNSYRRFFDLGQPEKKPPFRQVFLLCYFRGRPRFSSGVAPMNFPKQITPCVFR